MDPEITVVSSRLTLGRIADVRKNQSEVLIWGSGPSQGYRALVVERALRSTGCLLWATWRLEYA